LNEKNKQIVSETESKFKDAKFLIFADCSGLSANDTNAFRRELKKNNVEMKVMKNTLTSIILKKLEINGTEPFTNGPTAIAFCNGDEVVASKLFEDFKKAHEGFNIKAGVLNNKVIDSKMIQVMAKLPKREVLLSKLLTTMQSPLLRLLNVLESPARGLINLINAKIKTIDK